MAFRENRTLKWKICWLIEEILVDGHDVRKVDDYVVGRVLKPSSTPTEILITEMRNDVIGIRRDHVLHQMPPHPGLSLSLPQLTIPR